MRQSTSPFSYALEVRALSTVYHAGDVSIACCSSTAWLSISMVSAEWSPDVGQSFLHLSVIALEIPPIMYQFPSAIADVKHDLLVVTYGHQSSP